jgi:hypothetical protein
MIDMTLWRRVAWYIAALVISVLGFGVLNASYAVMFPACIDCHAHVGVPFAYLDTGGFEGGSGLLWRGVFADLLLMLAAALVLALVMPHLRSHKRS